ncbi:MAG: hypothetical protein JRH08_16960 [Deltaproteobacteria bacterium]|nr:hypothetical protein [Deltaproteobacteria bacterium]MBW1931341.1 hypothetical protein [Deltaproteobacteria bacterium]MBW2026990.1 hypothetical protein [Deltaproteobacteria bacterium]MBW2127303.1 hypothetical protein [Deltaproteobacteria bacterium]
MATKQDVIRAMERVRSHMRTYYNVDLDDLEITHVPGYWQDKEPKMHPGHPLHGCLFCDGPFRASYLPDSQRQAGTYFDPIRDPKGRFSSPYRTWRLLYEYCGK